MFYQTKNPVNDISDNSEKNVIKNVRTLGFDFLRCHPITVGFQKKFHAYRFLDFLDLGMSIR